MTKYIEMSLAIGKELEQVELEDVIEWSKNNRQKYIDLYNQFQKEKEIVNEHN